MGIRSLRRREYMRAVIQCARVTGDPVAPWQGLADVEEHFADEADLLVELHREWLRVLVGRLHRGEIVAQRSASCVRDLYVEVSSSHPTLRGILDAHRADPALWEPTAREHAMLARIAGLSNEETGLEEAAAVGQALVHERVPAQRGALVRSA